MKKKQVQFVTVFIFTLLIVASYDFFEIYANAQSPPREGASNSTFFDNAFWQSVVSGLVVFVITAPGTWFLSKRIFRKKISAAPK
ncbi:MAG: hypothetical protein ACKPGT_00730, partial [Microcystis sp.]